jgi:hypothetical protein
MLQSLIDNIVVIFGGRVFQKRDIIPMGIDCASLLADLFHYLHDADFIQGLLKKNKKKLADLLISRSAILMMSFLYITLGLAISLIASILLSLK